MGARPLPRKFWQLLLNTLGKRPFLDTLDALYQGRISDELRHAYTSASSIGPNGVECVQPRFLLKTLSHVQRVRLEQLAQTEGFTIIYAVLRRCQNRWDKDFSVGEPGALLCRPFLNRARWCEAMC